MQQMITPFLWFDTEAENAAELYTSIFPNSRVLTVTRYSAADPGTRRGRVTMAGARLPDPASISPHRSF